MTNLYLFIVLAGILIVGAALCLLHQGQLKIQSQLDLLVRCLDQILPK